jgi:hypothetical protein
MNPLKSQSENLNPQRFRLLIFKERSSSIGNSSSVAVGQRVDLGPHGGEVQCKSITRIPGMEAYLVDLGPVGEAEVPYAAIQYAFREIPPGPRAA